MHTYEWKRSRDVQQEVTTYVCRLKSGGLMLAVTDEAPKAMATKAKQRLAHAVVKTAILRLLADGEHSEIRSMLSLTRKQAVAALKHVKMRK